MSNPNDTYLNEKNMHKSLYVLDKASLERATNYIQDYYSENISIDSLCRITYMGRTKFKVLFKQYFHCTVTEYIREVRINKAKDLLKNTSIPIIEVASMVGYNNPGRFSHIFMEDTGSYPSEYRVSNRSE